MSITDEVQPRKRLDEIRRGWQVLTLDDCAVLVRETVLPSNLGDIPYVGLEHIGENTLSLTGNGVASDVISAKTRFRERDVLFGKLRPYFRKVIHAQFSGICSTDIWVVRAKNGVEPQYLFYYMASQPLVDFASSASEGTRMPRAKWDYVSQYRLSVPPLWEQQAIAKTLGVLDSKINVDQRMNETLEEMVLALFKSWFVDFDPVRAKMENRDTGLSEYITSLFPDQLVNSEFGEIPEGWEMKPLDKIAQFLNGLALQKFPASNPQDSFPVIKIAELRNGISLKTGRTSREIPPKYIVKDGDFLFSWSGSLLAKFWAGGDGALNQHLFKVTSDQYPAWFFSQWIYFHLREFRGIASAKATTMGHIQRGHIAAAMTVCPPDRVIKCLGKIFAPLVDKMLKNDVESHTLRVLRDTLLPRLISGDIRVKSF